MSKEVLNHIKNKNILIMERVILSVSFIINVIGIILKHTLESTMLATPATAMTPAVFASLFASILLIMYTYNNGKTTKYILLSAIVLLIIKELLWMGSTVSILFYIIIVFSLFKMVKSKVINIAIVLDCITKLLLTISYLFDSVRYYGNICYCMHIIICLLAALSVSIVIYLIAHQMNC